MRDNVTPDRSARQGHTVGRTRDPELQSNRSGPTSILRANIEFHKPPRPHEYTSQLSLVDVVCRTRSPSRSRKRDCFRRTRWISSATKLVSRVRPCSFSGGAWGPDGHLYVTSHDSTRGFELGLPRVGFQRRLLETHDFPRRTRALPGTQPDRRFCTTFDGAFTRLS